MKDNKANEVPSEVALIIFAALEIRSNLPGGKPCPKALDLSICVLCMVIPPNKERVFPFRVSEKCNVFSLSQVTFLKSPSKASPPKASASAVKGDLNCVSKLKLTSPDQDVLK